MEIAGINAKLSNDITSLDVNAIIIESLTFAHEVSALFEEIFTYVSSGGVLS